MGGHKGSSLPAMPWSDANETAFIEICHEYAKAGKLQCTIFKSDVMAKINEEMIRSTNTDYGIERLTGKWNRLRKYYRQFLAIKEHTGVTWDPNTGKVDAPDPVWAHYFTIDKKQYNIIKNKGCPHFELLGQLFGGTTATGGLSTASTQPPPTSDEEQEQEDAFLTKGKHVRAVDLSDSEEIVKPVRHRKEPKKSNSNQLQACMVQWSSSLTKRDDESDVRQLYFKEKLARLQGKSSTGTGDNEATSEDPYSQARCMSLLNDMEGLDDDIYSKALTAFRKDPDFRMQFVMMPEARRRPVLERL